MSDVKIVEADLANQEHAVAVLTLVEEFSTDPMGGARSPSKFRATTRAVKPGCFDEHAT